VVTKYHVIEGASHFAARTNEGAAFQFERLVAHPAGVDIAILKFVADGAACLKLGQSTDAVEGQTVLVIGSPEGLQGTVSEGDHFRFSRESLNDSNHSATMSDHLILPFAGTGWPLFSRRSIERAGIIRKELDRSDLYHEFGIY
jgi:S1-C subfamily serine protease